MQTLLSRALSFFICAFITEKRAKIVYPKIFDVFFSDWLVSNQYSCNNRTPRCKPSRTSRVRVKMSRKS